MLWSFILILLRINGTSDSGGHLDPNQINVIRSVLHHVNRQAGAIVVATDTSSPVAMLMHFENRNGGLTLEARATERDIVVTRELWRLFRQENSARTELSVLPAVSDVLIASADRLKLLLPDASSESWEQFHAEWPRVQAVVKLTKPALSADQKTALIYVTVTRGPLDGEGSLMLLEHRAEGWTVTAQYVVIAS